ncbi:MAG TPA: HD domain-containing phosphohydrolase [Actinomycetota bacterium]|jgi:ribonuclease P protein subunit RPR2
MPDSPEDLATVHAQLIVFARELSEMYHLERERSHELEGVLRHVQETYLATMKTLAQVVEAKDRTTRGHLDRAHSLGVELARRIDPELAERPEVGYGFFLHDIGKVGIPEDILCKNGALSDPEWSVMREHPTIGAQIVAPIQFLGDAVQVIRHHHERFDGTGYPSRMRGKEIPLAARVFAVADSYDAMTSDRPYRDAMPKERALEEISGGSGSQFDPEVVEVFLDLAREESALAS